MKRKISLAVLVAMLLIFTSACSVGKGGASAKEIVIGSIQDLSGPGSVYGNSMQRGAELAVEEINAKGGINGKKIKLVPYDIKGSTEQAITSYERLANVDKAVAIVGPPLSNVGLACIPISNSTKVPIVGGFGLIPCLVDENGDPNPYMFLAQASASYTGSVTAEYAMKELGHKSFAILVRQDHAWELEAANHFIKYVEDNGGTITTKQFCTVNDKNYNVQITKMIESNPDMLSSWLSSDGQVVFVQQLNQIGSTLPIAGSNDLAAPFATMLPDPKIANDIYFAGTMDLDDPAVQSIREAYKKKFNEEPDQKSYIGYDEVNIIAQAIIKNGNKADSASIRDSLEKNTVDFQGAQGTFTIDAKTHMPTGLSLIMTKIENGEYVKLTKYSKD